MNIIDYIFVCAIKDAKFLSQRDIYIRAKVITSMIFGFTLLGIILMIFNNLNYFQFIFPIVLSLMVFLIRYNSYEYCKNLEKMYSSKSIDGLSLGLWVLSVSFVGLMSYLHQTS